MFPHKCPLNISSVFSQQNVFMCAAGELPSENLKLPLSVAALLQQFIPYFDMKQVHT